MMRRHFFSTPLEFGTTEVTILTLFRQSVDIDYLNYRLLIFIMSHGHVSFEIFFRGKSFMARLARS